MKIFNKIYVHFKKKNRSIIEKYLEQTMSQEVLYLVKKNR